MCRAPDQPFRTVRQGAAALASIRLTLFALALLAAGAWAVSAQFLTPSMGAGIPLALLAANLCAAMLISPRLRTDLPLTVLHVALLAGIALLAGARLAYFDGLATLDVGEEFRGALEEIEAGPLHPWRPDALRFRNEGFAERFATQGDYVATEHEISWVDADGVRRTANIGDDRPLILDGYRIYATPNRGYAPVFEWTTGEGGIEIGSVQLPAPGFRIGAIRPLTIAKTEFQPMTAAQNWRLPDGTPAWVMLDIPAPAAPPPGSERLNFDADDLDHVLVLRIGDRRHELRPGDSLTLPGGHLKYVRLNSWMGYRIVRDDFKEWLFAACMVMAVALGWYYLRRFRTTPWLKGET